MCTGVCYARCSTMVVSCYLNAGFVFGPVSAGNAKAYYIIACNTAFDKCFADCPIPCLPFP